jgi:hypothetical protein
VIRTILAAAAYRERRPSARRYFGATRKSPDSIEKEVSISTPTGSEWLPNYCLRQPLLIGPGVFTSPHTTSPESLNGRAMARMVRVASCWELHPEWDTCRYNARIAERRPHRRAQHLPCTPDKRES